MDIVIYVYWTCSWKQWEILTLEAWQLGSQHLYPLQTNHFTLLFHIISLWKQHLHLFGIGILQGWQILFFLHALSELIGIWKCLAISSSYGNLQQVTDGCRTDMCSLLFWNIQMLSLELLYKVETKSLPFIPFYIKSYLLLTCYWVIFGETK